MCIKKEKYYQLKTLFSLFLIPNKWKRTLTLNTSYAMVLDKAAHTIYIIIYAACVCAIGKCECAKNYRVAPALCSR